MFHWLELNIEHWWICHCRLKQLLSWWSPHSHDCKGFITNVEAVVGYPQDPVLDWRTVSNVLQEPFLVSFPELPSVYAHSEIFVLGWGITAILHNSLHSPAFPCRHSAKLDLQRCRQGQRQLHLQIWSTLLQSHRYKSVFSRVYPTYLFTSGIKALEWQYRIKTMGWPIVIAV